MRARKRIGRLVALLLAVPLSGVVQVPAPAPADQLFGWLCGYEKAQVRAVARDPLFSSLIELVVPDLQIVMNRDRSLPADLITQFGNSKRPVRVRDGRYLSLAGYRVDGGVSQSFLWFDLQQDRALGAIYVQFLNEVPIHRLILFSKRESGMTETADLPQAFQDDLAAWLKQAKLPELLPLYFAASIQEQHPLLHTPVDCAVEAAGRNGEDMGRCLSANREVAEMDLEVAWQQARVRAARQGLGSLQALEAEQSAWQSSLEPSCAAAPASDVDCRTQAVHARAEALLQWREAGVPSRPQRAHPAVEDAGGFRDVAAGIEFHTPNGWTGGPSDGGIMLQSPDQEVEIHIWTETGVSFAQATANMVAEACRNAAVDCSASTPVQAGQWNVAPDETVAGVIHAGSPSVVNWRADLVQARLPVLVLYRGSAAARIGHAAEIAAFRAGLQLLP